MIQEICQQLPKFHLLHSLLAGSVQSGAMLPSSGSILPPHLLVFFLSFSFLQFLVFLFRLLLFAFSRFPFLCFFFHTPFLSSTFHPSRYSPLFLSFLLLPPTVLFLFSSLQLCFLSSPPLLSHLLSVPLLFFFPLLSAASLLLYYSSHSHSWPKFLLQTFFLEFPQIYLILLDSLFKKKKNVFFPDNHDIISMKLYQLMVEHSPEEESQDWTKIEPSVSLLKSPKGRFGATKKFFLIDFLCVYYLFFLFKRYIFFCICFKNKQWRVQREH